MPHDGISTRLKTGFWPPGKAVSIRDGRIYCPLALHCQYNLVKSRSYSPHTQFLKARTDQQLLTFIRAWGPLYVVQGAPEREVERGISVRPVSQYRAFQRRLKALANLLLSFGERGRDGRECLLEYLAADTAWDAFSPPSGVPVSRFNLAPFTHGMNVSDWIAQASKSEVQQAAAFVLQVEFSATISLSVEHDGKQFQIAQKWQVGTLQEALQWMVWNDRIASCQECGEIFTVTPYRWKYDTDECAHKATDRAWRRKRRKEERAERPKVEKQAKLKDDKKGRNK
jgi:hypothetical protein